jgi:UDP-N-acetylglucosamine--N-acetylmuramyl-(pentapeptide) pyrophosphoryl-undecaprenol N-acetylglucosamine transferase
VKPAANTARGVLIMAGGTGGHIFPGLAVAESLRRRGVEVRWLGARGAMETRQVPPAGIPLDVVDIAGLRGKGARGWLLAPWTLLRAVVQASRCLREHRPSCAVSFGGYAAGPGGLAARLRGVPLLVHEQNRIPGMTNRVLARLARRVLQAFPGTWDDALQPVTCGNPVRSEVAALPAPAVRFAGRDGPARLLVTGGSQGAQALNRLVPAALGLLPDELNVEIRHQCGRGREESTRAAYREAGVADSIGTEIADESAPTRRSTAVADHRVGPNSFGIDRATEPPIAAESAPASAVADQPVGPNSFGIDRATEPPIAAESAPTRHSVEVSEFIDDMAEAYGWADLVVCRAGALTVSEVAAAGLPAVFVPFPHAVDDHQTRNAEYLVERGAALLLPEAGATAQALAELLGALLADRARRQQMAERARAAATPDAADRVAELCLQFAGPEAAAA